MVSVVAISDTHCLHEAIAVPDGDVLVHAGDFCSFGTIEEAQAFASFFRALPHPHKVIIAGNHDCCLERDDSLAPQLFSGCHYLFDSGARAAGLRFYGSPFQPWFLDWAFNLPRGKALADKWAQIPAGLDVLITHGPPRGVLDTTVSGDRAGCEDLAEAVGRSRPRVHIFGHIHEGWGTTAAGCTLFVNASICTFGYEPVNRAIVIDLPSDRALPAVVE